MSRWCGNGQKCLWCGMKYGDFRTGFTYQEVHDMLLDNHEDPKLWRYKRRRTVLGLWHQLKLELWEKHDNDCCLAVDHEERLAIEQHG